MPRKAKGLTAGFVEKGTRPGRYGDGAGLYLLVRSREAKFWVFRFMHAGKAREMGLGPARGRAAISLSEARAKARDLHLAVRAGRDPLAERDAEKAKADADAAKAKAGAMTFGAVADLFIGAHEGSWKHEKHRQQWHGTLRDYVLPVIGDLPVASVETSHVMAILEPLWRVKVETATRVRARIEAILDYATVCTWREGPNPARWRGHLDKALPKRRKVRPVVHYKALPWRDIGAFMQRLRHTFSMSARCLEFAVLTATRSNEARGALWSEIDLKHAVWTIPAARMKGAREHRVPLSRPAMAVLREMAEVFGSDGYVFPSPTGNKGLSDRALGKALRAAGGNDSTVHGLRSTFRDWAGEATNFARELAEVALAHSVGDQTEQAYQRGDLLEKRHKLMEAWASYCARPATAGKVVGLHAAAG
jgi:integrase